MTHKPMKYCEMCTTRIYHGEGRFCRVCQGYLDHQRKAKESKEFLHWLKEVKVSETKIKKSSN